MIFIVNVIYNVATGYPRTPHSRYKKGKNLDKLVALAFGRVVRKLRTEAGLSQEEVSFRAEIERYFVSYLELGRGQPTLTTVLKLAAALGLPPGELVALTHQELARRDGDEH
jgi:DNA-binding XRE family transcriptional regulator